MEAYNYRVYFGPNDENFLLVFFDENKQLLKIDKYIEGKFFNNMYDLETNL